MTAGLMTRGCDIPVVAVRVTPLPLGTPRLILRRIDSLRNVLDAHGVRMRTEARVLGDDRFFKPGYAKTNPASREAAEIAALDGITLDPTYASKAFASLLDAARSGAEGPLLFLHTSPGPPPDA
jgi:1-aminocyclopropane-1-carboxylate deaminase/D-cysteine desulfhydrase-like pyridoxal-dependent ACC family enzyme